MTAFRMKDACSDAFSLFTKACFGEDVIVCDVAVVDALEETFVRGMFELGGGCGVEDCVGAVPAIVVLGECCTAELFSGEDGKVEAVSAAVVRVASPRIEALVGDFFFSSARLVKGVTLLLGLVASGCRIGLL